MGVAFDLSTVSWFETRYGIRPAVCLIFRQLIYIFTSCNVSPDAFDNFIDRKDGRSIPI